MPRPSRPSEPGTPETARPEGAHVAGKRRSLLNSCPRQKAEEKVSMSKGSEARLVFVFWVT